MRIYNQNIWGNFSDKERIGNRNRLISSLISKYQPDFCCFQECNPSTSRMDDSIIDLLIDKYNETCVINQSQNFTPVLYNKYKFKVIEEDYIVFDGLNDWNSKSFTYAIFEEMCTSKKVCIISVHFWWQYRGDIDNIQRCENANQLANVVEKIYNKYNIPIFVCGDLNSGENTKQGPSGYNKMLTLGFVDVRKITNNSDEFHTCSSIYPKHTTEGVYYDGKAAEFTIDYIFTYKKELVKSIRYIVDGSKVARNSSDHSPIIYDFEI